MTQSKASLPNTIRKIIIIRTDRIGDVILSTPVIANVRRAFPHAHIAFMCQPETMHLLESNPAIDEIIVYNKKKSHKSILQSLGFALWLRHKRFDAAFVLHPTNRMHLITFLAGIPHRLGWNKKMGFLLTSTLPHTKEQGAKHEVEYSLDIIRLAGIPIHSKNLSISLRLQTRKKLENILTAHALSPETPYILIHPFASCQSRIWPWEHFQQLVRLLQKSISEKIIFIGQPHSSHDGILKPQGTINLCGKLSLDELLWLTKFSRLVISNDSGPMHIAAALHVPVIAIFGRKNKGLSPKRWRPLGESSFYFHKDAGCTLCLAHACTRGFECLRRIQPHEISQKALEVLGYE